VKVRDLIAYYIWPIWNRTLPWWPIFDSPFLDYTLMSSYMGNWLVLLQKHQFFWYFYDSKSRCLGNKDCRGSNLTVTNRELLYQYPCDIVMNLEVCRYCWNQIVKASLSFFSLRKSPGCPKELWVNSYFLLWVRLD
jgi:hypothetical protein